MTDDQLDNDLAEENNASNEQVDEQPVEDISAAADDETAEDYHVETPEENSEGSDEPDDVRVAVEHHEDLDLAEHLRIPTLREPL